MAIFSRVSQLRERPSTGVNIVLGYSPLGSSAQLTPERGRGELSPQLQLHPPKARRRGAAPIPAELSSSTGPTRAARQTGSKHSTPLSTTRGAGNDIPSLLISSSGPIHHAAGLRAAIDCCHLENPSAPQAPSLYLELPGSGTCSAQHQQLPLRRDGVHHSLPPPSPGRIFSPFTP